jgi:hypothetical protein
MPWDDELERLTIHVMEHLGEDVYDQAIARAWEATWPKDQPSATARAAEHLPLAEGEAAAVESDRWATLCDSYYVALKAELRRLARAH